MRNYKTPLPWFVTEFFEEMDQNPGDYGADVWNLRRNIIEKAFKEEELDVRLELADNYFSLEKYFPFELMPYQRCAIGLWLCTYYKDVDLPRWHTLFVLGGRGLGKDGLISFSAFCLTSPYNPVSNYDVDICANNEEQAVRPVKALSDEVIHNEAHAKKLSHFYRATKEMVLGKKNKGVIKGRTNNPKGRDGMRSGCVVFNELHQYQNYDNIDVFSTGLGKVKHPRTLAVTTNGYVVEGVLDDYIEQSEEKLKTGNDGGWLPFLFRLTNEKDVMDPSKWIQANPRLKRSPELMQRIEAEFESYKKDPQKNTSFATKRMNFRKLNERVAITSEENLKATKKPLINLEGHECVCGVDYAKTSDWVAVNLHFKVGDNRYDINHAFVCTNGADFTALNCPHKQWAQQGFITYVTTPDISPDIVADYIKEQQRKYHIKALAIDEYRWTILAEKLEPLGYTLKAKNLKLVRPSDIAKIVPVVDRCFRNQLFYWGDNTVLRWAANNAELKPLKKSKITQDGELDLGNFVYGKQDPVKRKTDPWMALVACMTVEDQLNGYQPTEARRKFRVRTY